MNKKHFYITTTSSYVNADPHIGYALELIQTDAMARYKKLMGYDVAFGYGSDEHGLKIYKKALEEGKNPRVYCDEKVKKFMGLKKLLNLDSTHYMRSTDPNHEKAAQEFWNLCFANGDIYKKNYRIKYCYGCELEKTDSELANDVCPIHPNLKIQNYEEENYFFRFSKYQKKLLEFYGKNKDFVLPDYRQKEIETFVKKGLEDFSVSRLKSKMPWGVDVPNDPDHVMYVWFDALVYYISTLGWPTKLTQYEKFWPGVQTCGKDNLRQQSAIWQAMLMSAGLPNSRQIFIHGFITSEGQKMSKSLGNVIDPMGLVDQYGIDAVRYYLLREIPSTADGDFSHSRMKEIYNADLANGLGNLVARVAKLAQGGVYKSSINNYQLAINNNIKFHKTLEEFRFNDALAFVWTKITSANKQIDNKKPWELQGVKLQKVLEPLIAQILEIASLLQPFIPQTAEKILEQFKGPIIKTEKPLFPRIK